MCREIYKIINDMAEVLNASQITSSRFDLYGRSNSTKECINKVVK